MTYYINQPRASEYSFADIRFLTEDPHYSIENDEGIEGIGLANFPTSKTNDDGFLSTEAGFRADQNCDEFVLVNEGRDSYHWENSRGEQISASFSSFVEPSHVVGADLDDDGDADLFIQYEDGTSEISWSVRSQLLSASFLENPEYLPEVADWLSERLPSLASHCPGFARDESHLVDIFLLSAILSQMACDALVLMDAAPEHEPYDFFMKTKELVSESAGQYESLNSKVGREWSGRASTECAEEIDTNLNPYLQARAEEFDDFAIRVFFQGTKRGVLDGGIGLALSQISYSPKNPAAPAPVILGMDSRSESILATITVPLIIPETPLARSRIREGDRIVAVNGSPIDISAAQILRQREIYSELFDEDGNFETNVYETTLHNEPAYFIARQIAGPLGSEVTLTVERGGKKLDVVVTRDLNLLPLGLQGRAF